MNKKVLLMILDGWGKSPDPKVSAIDHAHTPFIDSLYTKAQILPSTTAALQDVNSIGSVTFAQEG